MNALVIYNGKISTAPRPSRFIDHLKKKGFYITVISYSEKNVSSVINKHIILKSVFENSKFILLNRLRIYAYNFFLLFRLNYVLKNFIWNLIYDFENVWLQIKSEKYTHILVEDISLSYIAFKYHQRYPHTKLILDAREYYPKEFESSYYFNWFIAHEKKRLCRRYLKYYDSVITVNESISLEYKNKYGIQCYVIRSVPFFSKIPLKRSNSDIIKIVHHGTANKDRNLEFMINVFSKLKNNFKLDIYLTGNLHYISYLKMISKNYPNINIKDPIPFSNIINVLSNYDLGLYLLPSNSFNNHYSLPNKYFEFIQARLGLIHGPSPEMCSLSRKYNYAIIIDDLNVDKSVSIINNISINDIVNLKTSADEAAHIFNWEMESRYFDDIL